MSSDPVKLGVHPKRHAARRGWSIRRLAYARQAFRSSGSRSGISSRIRAASRPAANRSRMSLTRMRIPRTHGRPPHCFGLTVIRSSKEAMARRYPTAGWTSNVDSRDGRPMGATWQCPRCATRKTPSPMQRPDPVHLLIPEGWQRFARGRARVSMRIGNLPRRGCRGISNPSGVGTHSDA